MFPIPLRSWARARRLVCLSLPAVLLPLSAADLKPGTAEIWGFGGGAYLRCCGTGTTKALGGAGVAVALHRRAWLGADFAFVPLGSYSATITEVPGTVIGGSASGRLLAFDGGVQFNLGPPQSRAVPYISGNFGFGHASAEGNVRVQQGAQVMQMSYDASSTDFSAGGGFGVRIYAGDRWGLRPEIRLARYFSEGQDLTAVRFTLGLFFQFGKK